MVDTLTTSGPEDAALLGRQVRKGLAWSLTNSVLGKVFTMFFGVVMARLLVPTDYGVFTIALVTLTLLQSMNELGTSVAIVRWQGDVSRPARTATTLSILASSALYLVCFVSAPAISDVLGAPSATLLIRLLALGVILDGISTIPDALLTRGFLQARRAAVDIVAMLISTAVSLALAATGHGALSLVWGMLAGNVVATAMVLVIAPERPIPGWDPQVARRLIRSGLPLAATSLLSLGIVNVDYIVVGRELGPTRLGLYLLAFNLSSWMPSLVTVAVRRIALPAFSQLKNNDDAEALSRSVVHAITWLFAAGTLAALLLGFLGAPLISFVYGRRWLPAADALRFLAILCAARVVIEVCYDILVSIRRAKALLVVQAIWLVTLVPALAIGTRLAGIRGAAIAHAVVAAGIVVPANLIAIHRGGVSLAPLRRLLARPIVAGAAASVVLLLGRSLGLGPVAELMVVGSCATLVFAAIAVPAAGIRKAIAFLASRRHRATAPDGAPNVLGVTG